MNSLINNINSRMKGDPQQYASNDSGLSCNSLAGADSNSPYDFTHCDDLTKSLFMNSFGGTGLIQDDDIYSYKSKISVFPNKLLSFNLAKSENFNFKNSSNFTAIIHDLENLKLSDAFHQSTTITNSNNHKNINSTNGTFIKDYMNINTKTAPSAKIVNEIKTEFPEKTRAKRSVKKTSTQEYMSSSIKDYKGDKALNDIVSFIQGSPKCAKVVINKSKVHKSASNLKIDQCPNISIKTAAAEVVDSGVASDNNSSPRSSDIIITTTTTNSNELDSGTQSSSFVSLNNSDEDNNCSQLFIKDFQPVLSKKQKKITVAQNDTVTQSKNAVNNQTKLSNKSSKKSGKIKLQTKDKNCTNTVLYSKQCYQKFLSDQYASFIRKFNATS